MPPSTTAIAKTSANSGDAQSGTVGQPLASPIQVVVTEGGSPSSGVTVTWSTTAGGSLTPASGPTGADGTAGAAWTLGTTSGAQTARATLAGATGSPVTFSATAVPGSAAALADAGGNGQTGETTAQLEAPVQARVTDQFGNAVAGTDVSWSATGATVSAPTVPSNTSGISQITVTLGGTEGQITIVAEADGLAGSPVNFSATAVVPVPAPTSIAVTASNNLFRSERNQTVNPAVDTVAAGGTVTWTWAVGAVQHNVTSTGSPSFPSSTTKSAPASHEFVFSTPGTYSYYCTVHGSPTDGMRGRIRVK
jgi:plastocyanin